MSTKRFTQEVARNSDSRLERMAATANSIASETGDQRWNEAALALLGARRLFRELMQDRPSPEKRADTEGANTN